MTNLQRISCYWKVILSNCFLSVMAHVNPTQNKTPGASRRAGVCG